MANKTLFNQPGRHVPMADTKNAAGGVAYKLTSHQALAQFATTGTFNDTYYTSSQGQLSALLTILNSCSPEFIAKAAIYARNVGFMKDMPAYLVAYLFVRAKSEDLGSIPEQAFNQVIGNGKMVRNFVQFMLSATLIKADGNTNKSLGSRAQRVLRKWFNTVSSNTLISGSVGNTPSLKDVLRLVRPKATTKQRESLFAWLADKPGKELSYPEELLHLLSFREGKTDVPPKVDFRLLVDSNCTPATWKKIADQASWQMTRMNLNTFKRHGVLDNEAMAKKIADRLQSPEEIHKAKVFPYQLLAAWKNTEDLPVKVRNAIQNSLDIALDNVPEIKGKVVVCPDTSGSMTSPVTGHRTGATTKVRCIDVAALVASALMRKNDETLVLPFDTQVHDASSLNPKDSVVTNAEKLARFGGIGYFGGKPMEYLVQKGIKADLVFYVSDNESWADRGHFGGTSLMEYWKAFKRINPKAKLVLLDITPHANSQAVADKDILRIGGFSDAVFQILPDFMAGKYGADAWVEQIEKISID